MAQLHDRQRSRQPPILHHIMEDDLNAPSARLPSQPDDARQLWAALAGEKRFPLKELVPLSYTVGHLL